MTLLRTARGALLAGAASVAMGGTALAVDLAEPNTLTVGLASEATSIDPHFHNLTPNSQIGKQIFDNLINQGPRQELLPGLATEWGPIDDLTWEFKLREGVTFHDGAPFTADDVVCTFERVPNVPNSPSSFELYTKGKTVKKIDDFTIHITTEDPYPLMANDVSTISIISDEVGCGATTEEFNNGTAAFGTGPWKFVEYVPGDRIVLEANENYWDGAPAFDKVVLKPIKSGPARVAALLAGDVDLINDVPTTDLERLRSDDAIDIFQGPSNRVIYLHMDQFREDSPFVSAKDGSDIKNPLLD
ncbi:MAG: ABC transporter substrate-binding protein, partial [Pseudomonadota bacterium]